MHFPIRLRPKGTARPFNCWQLARGFAAGIGILGLLHGNAMAAPPQSSGPLQAPTQLKRKHDSGPAAHPNARMDVNMVLVPVTVTDLKDKPVTDLKPGSFKVFEDGIEQTVVSLHHEDGPVSMGFIFDASSSMKNRMEPSVKAMEQFLKATIPGDEYFLIRFSDRPELLTGFTSDPATILDTMSGIRAEGWTSLNDAIFLGAQRLKKAKNPRRALIILSDGGDNSSRYSDSEVRSVIREMDVRVYSIGLFERPHFLEKLAADTGGRAFWVKAMDDLPETVDKLGEELRNQYVLGYSTNNRQNDGKYRKVRVELLETIRRMSFNVFWRRGYFAPTD